MHFNNHQIQETQTNETFILYMQQKQTLLDVQKFTNIQIYIIPNQEFLISVVLLEIKVYKYQEDIFAS